MKDYFDAEMRLLNESAAEFASAYPEQAALLNLAEIRDRDPYIERLLEGMAYLTAQIRSRIDDDVPEICQTLLGQMWPQFIRPFPSCTIIEFKSRFSHLQSPREFPKGTTTLSDAVGNVEEAEEKRELIECEYRTISPVILNPLRIAAARMEESSKGETTFRLDFEIGANAKLETLTLDPLTLYLHGYPDLTLDLWHCLTTSTREVRVSFGGPWRDREVRLGDQSAIVAAHMELDSSMLPRSGRSFVGTHLLHEYFCFREKFLFIHLLGLEKLDWPENCSGFSLEIKVDRRLPSDYHVDAGTFRLHCTPAVNLFPAAAETIKLDHKRSEYRLLADTLRRNAKRIYSVDEVHSQGAGSGGKYVYQSLYTLDHWEEDARYYQLRIQDRGLGHEEMSISFGGNSDFEVESLGCNITAYNGHYPRRYLNEGSIIKGNSRMPEDVGLVNITRPTPTYMPPHNDDYQWGLVAHLGLNYSSLIELDTLKRLLRLYEWTGRKENLRKIDGIQEISLELYQELHQGALMRGLEISLTLHEGNYASIADIALFGQILHRFFAMYATINTVVRSRVTCHPSGKELIWEPVLGEISLM